MCVCVCARTNIHVRSFVCSANIELRFAYPRPCATRGTSLQYHIVDAKYKQTFTYDFLHTVHRLFVNGFQLIVFVVIVVVVLRMHIQKTVCPNGMSTGRREKLACIQRGHKESTHTDTHRNDMDIYSTCCNFLRAIIYSL